MRADIGVPKNLVKPLNVQMEADIAEFLANKPKYKKIQYHAGNNTFLFVAGGDVIAKGRSLSVMIEKRDAWLKDNKIERRSDAINKMDFSTNKNIRVGKATIPFNPLKNAWILVGGILEENHAYALAYAKRLNSYLGN